MMNIDVSFTFVLLYCHFVPLQFSLILVFVLRNLDFDWFSRRTELMEMEKKSQSQLATFKEKVTLFEQEVFIGFNILCCCRINFHFFKLLFRILRTSNILKKGYNTSIEFNFF